MDVKALGNSIMNVMMKFVNLKGVVALKEGMLTILPLTVCGSIFLIIAALPFKGVTDIFASVFGLDWSVPFWQVVGGSFAIIGMIACFSIAYFYVKNNGYDALPAGVLSVATFFIIQDSFVKTKSGEIVKDVVAKAWTGGQGMITAILVGLFVGYTYSWFIEKKIVIRMPDSVPRGVATQFTALIPAAFIFAVSAIVYAIFKFGLGTTFIEWIYKAIQVPLQVLTDSLPGAIGIAFFISFLWWFGVHGQSIVNGVVVSLLTANSMANAEILKTAGSVTVAGGGHIVTQQFLDSFIILSGSGITFGVVIAMLFAARSEQYKSLGKMAIVPGLFNINEPVTFGFPIVLNPIMFIPFVLVPVIAALLVYGSIASGFLEPFSGVLLPWSTPLILSGLMVAGWKGALIQIIILIISVVAYYPFFKKQDNITYTQEHKEAIESEKVAAPQFSNPM